MDKAAIAHSYDSQPSDPTLQPHWDALANECVRIANILDAQYHISYSHESEPYASAQAMFDDLNNGYFVVSLANCEHPIFTPEENVAWRTVHDILGHYRSGGTFSWIGEQLAWNSQASYHSELAQLALKTEILGQTASYSVNGTFPTQKLVLID